MATIYRLVTQLTADPRPMQEGVDRGTRILKEYAQAAGTVLSSIPKNLTGAAAVQAGTVVGQALIAGMEAGFQARQTELREALVRGVINRAEYERLGAENARAYNTVFLNTLTNRAFSKIVPDDVRAQIVGSLKEAGVQGAAEFENALTRLGGKLRSFGRDLTQTGRELTIALTAPIIAGTIAALASADNFEHAVNSIRTNAGVAGPALESMAGHVRNLFLSLPNSAADIAKALQTITTYSGPAGVDLERIATSALNLSRITGTDLATNVESTQRAFRGWGVATTDQVRAMDTLFKTAQQSGTTVSNLADSLAHFQPAFQQLGLGFGEAAALIGQFERNGINADTVLSSLQTALSRFAAKGIEGHDALQLIIRDIKNARTESEATHLASLFLGGREAAQFSTAVRNGTLDLETFSDRIRQSATSIDETASHVDQFGTRLAIVGHTAALSSALIGQSIQKAFVNFAPVATGALGTITELVRSFLSLPAPILSGTGAIVALLAALGPTILAFGALSKGVGATMLAFGLIRDGRAAVALAQIQGAAVGAGAALTEAETAAAKLLVGLRLLAGATVILAGLAIIFEFWREFTARTREAQERVDRFTTSLGGLSETQLTINTQQMERELTLRQKQLDDIGDKIASIGQQQLATPQSLGGKLKDAGESAANALGFGDAFRALVPNNNPLLPLIASQDDLNASMSEGKLKLDALHQATEEARQSAERAAAAQALFNRQVNELLTKDTHLHIDAHGDALGTLRQLQAEAVKLNDMLHSTTPLTIPTGVVEAGLARVNDAMSKLRIQNKNLTDVFPQLSEFMKELEREVAALVSRTKLLGTSFEQLGDSKLSAAVLSSFNDIDRLARSFGESMSLDAQKARELRAQLKDTFVVRIEANPTGSNLFTVDVVGNVVRLDTSKLTSGTEFGKLVFAGLDDIRNLAEQVQAEQQRLAVAAASGNLAATHDAELALERYYARANEGERTYRQAIERSNVSVAQREEALKALDVLNSQFGIEPAKLTVTPGLSQDDINAFAKSAQTELDNIPSLRFKVIPFTDLLELRTASDKAAQTLIDAQLAALAGNKGASEGLRKAALDQFAVTQKTDAQLARTGPIEQRVEALRRLTAAAQKAGFSVGEVAKSLDDARPVSQVLRIADAFSSAASAAFGANSAVAAFAGGLDSAVAGAKALLDTMNAIKASGKNDIAGLIASGASIVTGIIGAISAISSLFGKSQLDIEHDNILRQNNDALDNLRNTLDRNAGTAGRLDQLARALALTTTPHFFDLVKANEQKGFDITDPSKAVKDALSTILSGFGLTLEQANAAAKALGITLLDSKGNLVGLKAFGDALALQAKIITSLGQDLSTQQKLLAVRASLAGGQQTPQQKLDDAVSALAHTLDSQGGTLGASLTAASKQGGDALRAALGALVDQIVAGTLTVDQLGGLTDVGQLLDAIGGVSDSMNNLTSATNSAIGALLNVPAGFKRALAEFNAQDPQQAPGAPKPPPAAPAPPPTDTVPTRGPDPTGPLLNLVKQVQDRFTTPLVGSVSGPVDAMERLQVSANDVADALDAMFHVKQSLTDRGDLSGNPVDKRRLDVSSLAGEVIARVRNTTPTRSAAPGTGDIHIHGPINVDARDKPASELFDVIKKEAQKVARQKTGNSTRVLDALQG